VTDGLKETTEDGISEIYIIGDEEGKLLWGTDAAAVGFKLGDDDMILTGVELGCALLMMEGDCDEKLLGFPLDVRLGDDDDTELGALLELVLDVMLGNDDELADGTLVPTWLGEVLNTILGDDDVTVG